MVDEEDEMRMIDSAYFTSKEALMVQFEFAKVLHLPKWDTVKALLSPWEGGGLFNLGHTREGLKGRGIKASPSLFSRICPAFLLLK